ncbi:hypothetical protein AXK11_08690 [Cephaloticoccus primus]|uniref:SpoVT-AbrB domain-containing protein n=1 Tax=Cephaloticoccus primus TaxID=1548207 RepID=A0A139SHZ7_9BACT|nr:hypothetical protein [Cephaloticoccus primus]KXU34114.1 hypothetical protein AXK11_08690 [Cephaloticoccus primus]
MRTVTKVIKMGDSKAVRLPREWKGRAKELVVELQDDGEILLYDPVEREKAFEKRLAALRAFSEGPPLDLEFERPW